jgi:hypothetical protein
MYIPNCHRFNIIIDDISPITASAIVRLPWRLLAAMPMRKAMPTNKRINVAVTYLEAE